MVCVQRARMYIGAYCNAPGKQGSFVFLAPFRCARRRYFALCQARVRLTVRSRESQHNPALKYAPDGRKISHGLMGAAAAAAADRNNPPPDVALCRVFRAHEQGSFAQVGCCAACCCCSSRNVRRFRFTKASLSLAHRPTWSCALISTRCLHLYHGSWRRT